GTGLFFIEAAERLIPDDYAVNAKIAGSIISKTARLVLTPTEDRIVRERNSTVRQRLAGTLSDQTNALAAQNKSLWSDAERVRLKKIAQDSRNHYTNGPHKGKPIVERITKILNREFNRKRLPRTTDAVRGEIESARREQGIGPVTRIDWNIVRPKLEKLAQQQEYLYPADTRSGHPGEPNWKAIAAVLCGMFPDQPTITAKNCSAQYVYQRK
ncbi:MAG: hypothetical protein V1876_01005, partial [Candidatus Peregrinibacteria bacterium]